MSVATGQNDFWPLYMGNGLVHNHIRRAHSDAMTLIAFLAVPKGRPFNSCIIICTYHMS